MNLRAFLALMSLASAPAWANNVYLQPGGYAIVNRSTYIYCLAQPDDDPNPKWNCGCYFLNRRGAGVTLFAHTRQEAETKALPMCNQIIPNTQEVDCQRM